MDNRHGASAARALTQAIAAVETLEGRRMLAASAMLDGNGILKVLGTDSQDSLVVTSDGTTISARNVNTSLGSWPVSMVRGIDIDARGEADRVTIRPNDDDYPGTIVGATIRGGSGNDTLEGGSGNDSILGEAGNDEISGKGGHDTLDGGAGADKFFGGAGTDTADYGSRTAPLRIYLDGAANDGETGEGDDVHYTVENVQGGWGSDRIEGHSTRVIFNGLNGGEGHDTLVGGPGDDVLDGWGGHDELYGGEGNDHLMGWVGYDKLYGNNGADTLDGEQDGDTLNGGLGADNFNGGEGYDVADYSDRTENLSISIDGVTNDGVPGSLVFDPMFRTIRPAGAEADNVRTDIEAVWGGSGNDTITVPAASTVTNVLIGNGGNDFIDGGGGYDWLYGGDGDDIIVSRDGGADHISGGAGHDLHKSDAADGPFTDFEGVYTGYLIIWP